MAYPEKFQALADAAQTKVQDIPARDADALRAADAVALDIRDKQEHDAGHKAGSVHVSRGKLKMNVETALLRNLYP